MTMLARLKPFNDKRGQLTKIYMFMGLKFLAEKGWYEVPDAIGEKLKELHQNHYDEESAFLFDVASQEEAEKIDQKEEDARVKARTSARQPANFRGRQRTQALPVNNAGGLAGLPGDFSTEDLYTPIHGNAPAGPGAPSDPLSDRNDEEALNAITGADSDLDEGRLTDVGKVGGNKKHGPKTR